MKLSTNTASKLVIYRSEGTEREKKKGKESGAAGHTQNIYNKHTMILLTNGDFPSFSERWGGFEMKSSSFLLFSVPLIHI